MSVNGIRCEATLRQRIDKNANAFLPILKTASIDFLTHINQTLTPTSRGHIPGNNWERFIKFLIYDLHAL
jgi:hypothetical protein